ncbi:VOC family protein [Aquimarina sp. 2201CG5-10]|uniref:VOC family protein n=1 Tax=Aquimarina callyspongiae TaxID=3098150 RepID=UPI002AB42496|nr:VOC family protein [Aquimarina sp. 2201CG5-10]MDY8137430.1 VOC family protein [Aquimarina sp. 2201CG5-10]
MNDKKNHELLSIKTVIRTKDYTASKQFYTEILMLKIAEEYDDGDGSRGSILRIGPADSNAFIEISEISDHHNYFQQPFSKSINNDKIDLQIRTNDVNFWANRLKTYSWNSTGPVLRPWGSYYLYLRDPDGLQIIIYQEKEKAI